MEHNKLVELAEKHFGGLDGSPTTMVSAGSVPYCRFSGGDVSDSFRTPGPSCSKLTTSLVNVLLKF